MVSAVETALLRRCSVGREREERGAGERMRMAVVALGICEHCEWQEMELEKDPGGWTHQLDLECHA